MKKQIVGEIGLRPQARIHDLVVRELPDEELVYDLKTHKACCLNKTAAAVWNLCDGQNTFAEIASLVAQEMNAPMDDTTVWLALGQLSKANLLIEPLMLSTVSSRLSRREAIRKLGAAALPMVVSVIAPIAAQAASCIATGTRGTCTATGGNNCCSTCCNNTTDICLPTGLTNSAPCERDCQCTNSTMMKCPSATPRICV